MGLFSKKEDVPEIPPAPTIPELPKREGQPEKKDLPELPSFPSTPQTENLNQSIVKSAVIDAPSEDEEINVEIPSGLDIKEESSIAPMIPPRPQVREPTPQMSSLPSISSIPRPLGLNANIPNKPITSHAEPIFVRIDKFQSAQKNFEGIKEKVKEIESIISKIKDVKSNEETELKGWTEDVEKIKVRLAEIDSDIFNQI